MTNIKNVKKKNIKKRVIILFSISMLIFIFAIATFFQKAYSKNYSSGLLNSNSNKEKYNSNSVIKEELPKKSKVEQDNLYKNKVMKQMDTSLAKEKSANKNISTIVKNKGKGKKSKEKVVYLTIDDGPSANVTPQVLNILKKYNVKATFFTIGYLANKNPEILKRMDEEGHLICNHSYSHKYKEIYKSPEAFIDEIKKCDETLSCILGKKYTSGIIRFPGGSAGKKLEPFREAVNNIGYKYIDWNALSKDAEGKNVSVSTQLSNVKITSGNKNKIVLLIHDGGGNKTTVKALPKILEYFISKGYKFKTIKDYDF